MTLRSEVGPPRYCVHVLSGPVSGLALGGLGRTPTGSRMS